MKRTIVLLSLIGAVCATSEARAETVTAAATTGTNLFERSGRFGLGLGSGTFAAGLSGKVFLGNHLALQGIVGLGYGYGLGVGTQLNIDAVYEMPKIWGNDILSINWHVGGGGALAFYPGLSPGIGIEAVAGPSVQLAKVPFEFVIDARPTVYFGSGWNDFYFGSGASARYFF